MDNPAKLHKLTVFSQLLVEFHIQRLDVEHKIIKAAGLEDLRTMLLNRYPLKLNEMPTTLTAPLRKVEELLPDIEKIISN